MTNNNSGSKNEEEVGSYFLEVARGAHKKKEEEMEEDTEDDESPTELNTINSSGGFLVVSTDKISVKYPSVNLHGHDVGVVQANKPAPVKRLVYYFEIYVKDSGAKGQIAIGFTPDNFKMRRQPGWEPHSFGYHGDDGMLYRGQGKGEAFGPTYTANDIVGAGINYASHEFFFTKNGAVVGTVYNDVKGSLFPTIAVHSQNEEVHDFEKQERMKQQMTVEKISLPPNVTQENGFDEQDIMYALNERKTLRQLIKNGEIDAALGKLHDWYPQIVQDDKSATCFLLHCQKFIELVRVGALEEAVKYGRIQLAKFFGLAGFEDFVQDCVALLAYEQPQESSVGYLLEDSQREVVADAVNAMILSMNPNLKDSHGCLQSCLERLLRQLTACCLERRSLNGDQGEAFYLHRVLNIGKKC
ncbi:ran-binding protein m like protein [Quercus suber]|uniref:Ran-binding protein m like protein n=1 Tax=Quercus suber TaxID=58331 RepID=A0AAW0LJF2_QUESU